MYKDIEPIKVTERVDGGKGAARKLRKEGLIPGVVYNSKSNYKIQFNPKDMHCIHSYADVFPIELNGAQKLVLIRDLQKHPISKRPLHCDLYEVDMDQKISVKVPLHLNGKSIGVQEGGILDQRYRMVPVRCLPREIPEFLETDISHLQINDALTMSEMPEIPGVEILLKPKDILVYINVKGMTAEEEVEGEEGEGEEGEGAEGEAAEGAAAPAAEEGK